MTHLFKPNSFDRYLENERARMEQTMKTQFTPGPWQSKHDFDIEGVTTIIANVDGEQFADGTTTYSYDVICVCEDEFAERLPNAQANARLIRAAPKLYEALDEALGLALDAYQLGTYDAEAVKRLEGVLAEARGGK